eukprot:CFRG2732T1
MPEVKRHNRRGHGGVSFAEDYVRKPVLLQLLDALSTDGKRDYSIIENLLEYRATKSKQSTHAILAKIYLSQSGPDEHEFIDSLNVLLDTLSPPNILNDPTLRNGFGDNEDIIKFLLLLSSKKTTRKKFRGQFDNLSTSIIKDCRTQRFESTSASCARDSPIALCGLGKHEQNDVGNTLLQYDNNIFVVPTTTLPATCFLSDPFDRIRAKDEHYLGDQTSTTDVLADSSSTVFTSGDDARYGSIEDMTIRFSNNLLRNLLQREKHPSPHLKDVSSSYTHTNTSWPTIAVPAQSPCRHGPVDKAPFQLSSSMFEEADLDVLQTRGSFASRLGERLSERNTNICSSLSSVVGGAPIPALHAHFSRKSYLPITREPIQNPLLLVTPFVVNTWKLACDSDAMIRNDHLYNLNGGNLDSSNRPTPMRLTTEEWALLLLNNLLGIKNEALQYDTSSRLFYPNPRMQVIGMDTQSMKYFLSPFCEYATYRKRLQDYADTPPTAICDGVLLQTFRRSVGRLLEAIDGQIHRWCLAHSESMKNAQTVTRTSRENIKSSTSHIPSMRSSTCDMSGLDAEVNLKPFLSQWTGSLGKDDLYSPSITHPLSSLTSPHHISSATSPYGDAIRGQFNGSHRTHNRPQSSSSDSTHPSLFALANITSTYLNKLRLLATLCACDNDSDPSTTGTLQGIELLSWLYDVTNLAVPGEVRITHFLFAQTLSQYLHQINIWVYEGNVPDANEELGLSFCSHLQAGTISVDLSDADVATNVMTVPGFLVGSENAILHSGWIERIFSTRLQKEIAIYPPIRAYSEIHIYRNTSVAITPRVQYTLQRVYTAHRDRNVHEIHVGRQTHELRNTSILTGAKNHLLDGSVNAEDQLSALLNHAETYPSSMLSNDELGGPLWAISDSENNCSEADHETRPSLLISILDQVKRPLQERARAVETAALSILKHQHGLLTHLNNIQRFLGGGGRDLISVFRDTVFEKVQTSNVLGQKCVYSTPVAQTWTSDDYPIKASVIPIKSKHRSEEVWLRTMSEIRIKYKVDQHIGLFVTSKALTQYESIFHGMLYVEYGMWVCRRLLSHTLGCRSQLHGRAVGAHIFGKRVYHRLNVFRTEAHHLLTVVLSTAVSNLTSSWITFFACLENATTFSEAQRHHQSHLNRMLSSGMNVDHHIFRALLECIDKVIEISILGCSMIDQYVSNSMSDQVPDNRTSANKEKIEELVNRGSACIRRWHRSLNAAMSDGSGHAVESIIVISDLFGTLNFNEFYTEDGDSEWTE